jgi:Putative transposase
VPHILGRWGGANCTIHSINLLPNTQVPAHRRDQLERLIRYTARGAVSLERLAEEASGDLIYTFTRPWSDGTTGIKLSPVELLEKLAALVPLPRGHLGRYGGGLAPHSKLRSTVIPTPRQQGVEGPAARPEAPHWSWARLLKRVFALDMAICLPPLCGRREPCDLPFCHRGALRIIAAITQGEVIRKILRHLKLSADPPHHACPFAPSSVRLGRLIGWVRSPQPSRAVGRAPHWPMPSRVASGATCVQQRCVP